ncbi:hypothetical protein ACSV5G_22160 [Agrobacterium cavarae]|uniref:hypothetical protein n=1 Tax=Agrobacterium cavarae TaxID=2528239 RepID=UPI003FD45A70
MPLIGELPNSNWSSIKSAIVETALSTVFSTVPIWFFPLISALFLSTKVTFGESVYATVSQGDLYIYAASLVGPLIFAITANYASWDDRGASPGTSRLGKLTFAFPYGTWFFIISIIVCAMAAICFGIARFSTTGVIAAELNIDNLFKFSVAIYAFSIFCLFCVTVYRNELASGKFNDAESTREFLEEWNNRHG